MTVARYVDILATIVTDLNDDRPSGVPEVTKRRVVPGEKITGPRMAVFLGNENLDAPRQSSKMDPLSRRKILVAVQCTGVTDDLAQLDETVAPLLAWAVEVLGMSTLDNTVHYVRETGTQRESILETDRFVIHATALFEVSYQTRRNNLGKSS